MLYGYVVKKLIGCRRRSNDYEILNWCRLLQCVFVVVTCSIITLLIFKPKNQLFHTASLERTMTKITYELIRVKHNNMYQYYYNDACLIFTLRYYNYFNTRHSIIDYTCILYHARASFLCQKYKLIYTSMT